MASPGALSPKLKAADLSGKVAIITGATRGIGKACAIALAKQSALCDLRAMSRAAPASAAGVHLMHQQSKKRPVSRQEVAAFDPHITIESMERIIKSSSAVENLVTNLVGQKLGQEEKPVKPTPVDSKCFQNFIYCTIMLNALTLGLQADLQTGGWTLVWFILENIFTTIFAAEMVIKIYFLQMGYFWNAKPRRPQYWNLLDFVIALLAIVDCWILTYQANADAPAIRVMQLLRIIRIAKLLRLRQELVAIIEGLFSSLQCMVWIGFLLLIVIYGFSIVCRNVMGNLTNSDFEDMINNEMYFGSLPRTMLTLFNICLIDSWGAIIWPQMLYNPWMVIPLVVFMSVTCFGLMNALIGVIVERTTAAQQSMSSMQEEALEEFRTSQAVREMKMYMVAQLLEAIDDSDEDRSGTINLQEFRQVQRKPHAAEIFAALNLPPGFEAKDLFTLLDSDGNGQLDRYEFLLGICRLIWCDEFQSQCLQNHAISLVREDIRSLQATVKDLSNKCQVQGSHPDIGAEMLKSISETVRNDYQEVLNSCLEKYWERAKELLGEKDAEKKMISLQNQTQEKTEKVQERRQRSDDSAVPAERVADYQCLPVQICDDTTGAALDDALNRAEVLLHTHCVPTPEEFQIQLPMEMLETVERLLNELVAASGALQLTLRADGILLVEGCSNARDCVGRIIQELAESGWSPLLEPGHNAPPDSGDETSSQPDDLRDQHAGEGIKKGRRKPRRAKKAKVPKQHELVAEPQPQRVD